MAFAFCSNYTEWRHSVKYTTYILHITATCFGYLNVAIIRLHTELQKKSSTLFISIISFS